MEELIRMMLIYIYILISSFAIEHEWDINGKMNGQSSENNVNLIRLILLGAEYSDDKGHHL